MSAFSLAAAALTAGMMLSGFWRVLSSSSPTKVSPGTGSQTSRFEAAVGVEADEVPEPLEEPGSPQAARTRTSPSAAAVVVMVVRRARMVSPG